MFLVMQLIMDERKGSRFLLELMDNEQIERSVNTWVH